MSGAAVRTALAVARWTVLAAVAGAFVAGVALPRLAGATPYVVLTGSMAPDLPPGTLVVTRPVAAGEVEVGDVVTYQLRSGRPEVVTHRVVERRADGEGRVAFRTRGDANEATDPGWVRPEQLRGEEWYAVPHLGRLAGLLRPDHRDELARALGVVLLGYAAALALSASRDRLARRREEQTSSLDDLLGEPARG